MGDKVRVLRIIEYVGDRDWVEKTIARSINGTHYCGYSNQIRVATIGTYPEILEQEICGEKQEIDDFSKCNLPKGHQEPHDYK